MFIVMIQKETIVYNKVNNRYEVSSIHKTKYSFKTEKEMVKKMNSMNYEYKNNIYKNQSGWFKVTEIDNEHEYMFVCTGLVYSKD